MNTKLIDEYLDFMAPLIMKDKDGETTDVSKLAEVLLDLAMRLPAPEDDHNLNLLMLYALVHILKLLDLEDEVVSLCLADENIHTLLVTLMSAAYYFGTYCAQNSTRFYVQEMPESPPNG